MLDTPSSSLIEISYFRVLRHLRTGRGAKMQGSHKGRCSVPGRRPYRAHLRAVPERAVHHREHLVDDGVTRAACIGLRLLHVM